ncbi:DIS3-like exonuclease 2 [Diabrotica undecimpunctata]|uniref:DIS3-like exonuclease 2 n=1 Tax=Diabrotica undecimpunctata TaxID=50387 RepID=UPI003B63F449
MMLSSVESLPNGNLEIGVHISDAAFYLQEGTELDQIVSQKATTIYLVDKAYHMLPIELCLACSLLPGDDKLSFSVFWEMTQNGDIVNTRFTRSILNSCVKLAYEHAQSVIENPDKEFGVEDFPQIYNGFEPKDLVNTINILQGIAVKLREKTDKEWCLTN